MQKLTLILITFAALISSAFANDEYGIEDALMHLLAFFLLSLAVVSDAFTDALNRIEQLLQCKKKI